MWGGGQPKKTCGGGVRIKNYAGGRKKTYAGGEKKYAAGGGEEKIWGEAEEKTCRGGRIRKYAGEEIN